MRDDFPAKAKDILAKRVGTHCSNPQCWKLTSGPRDDPEKAVNIGVAAHISAAAIGGPRYDPSLNPRQRSAITNAIWLCQNCAKLIDNDAARYTVDLLRQWKTLAEETARLGVESAGAAFALQPISDVELIKAYAQCFDRPAFQDQFRQEGSMEAFDKAIEDTIVGINTGSIRTRDGKVLIHTRGKVFLKDVRLRERMDTIVDLLRWIRFRYADAVKRKAITFHSEAGGTAFYCINESELAAWMDNTRTQVLQLFSEVCHQVGIHPPSVRPSHRRGMSQSSGSISQISPSALASTANIHPLLSATNSRLSVLVHELHAPLSAIMGAASFIKMVKDPAKKDAYAADINSWCSLINRLIHTMTLLDRDLHDFRFERTFLLAEVINPAVHSLELLLKERGFTKSQIHLADFSAVPMLWLDRLSFQLVIFHLLANAIKYASPNMPLRVVVGASHIGDKFHISVCDWGVGIDEGERELLFTPGHRGKKARVVDARGTGLGLATSKSIVETHGGTINFGSLRSPTEVQICLPDSLVLSAPNQSNT